MVIKGDLSKYQEVLVLEFYFPFFGRINERKKMFYRASNSHKVCTLI